MSGMRTLRFMATAAATIGLMFVAVPAQAGNGSSLHAGDVVCSDQLRSNTTVRFYGHIVNGSGTASIRTSATAGGPETVVWTQTGTNLSFNKYVSGAAGTHYRGCITITAHTVNTWAKSALIWLNPTDVSDIGPNIATLAPGGRACDDSGIETVRLTGTATADITWYVNGFDENYSSVGAVFSTTGVTVNTTFAADPNLTGLEMCIHNTSQQTISASYEMTIQG